MSAIKETVIFVALLAAVVILAKYFRFEEILVFFTILTGLVVLVNYVSHRVRGKKSKDKKQTWPVEWSKSFFPVLILVLVLRSFLFEPFRIPTGSMKPTLLEGDFILVNKYAYGVRLPVLGTKVFPVAEPKVGDVIVFRHVDGKDLIKRVIGVPGDHVKYIDKKLYINNVLMPTELLGETQDNGIFTLKSNEKLEKLNHDIFIYPQRIMQYRFDDVIVPANSYFVMGDNRDNSEDSRFWGFVPEQDLLGKAVLTWMSWDSTDASGVVPIRWKRIGKSVYEYQG